MNQKIPLLGPHAGNETREVINRALRVFNIIDIENDYLVGAERGTLRPLMGLRTVTSSEIYDMCIYAVRQKENDIGVDAFVRVAYHAQRSVLMFHGADIKLTMQGVAIGKTDLPLVGDQIMPIDDTTNLLLKGSFGGTGKTCLRFDKRGYYEWFMDADLLEVKNGWPQPGKKMVSFKNVQNAFSKI